MKIIEVKNLTKDYGSGKGIFDLTFEVNKGEVFGYLGPNGAGKTTTIRHLLGFLTPNLGESKILGFDCRTQSAVIQENLGYLPGEIAFFDDMSGDEFLLFMANLRGMKDLTKMNYLKEFFQLDCHGKIKKMSKGMKQKIGLITAFMHNPSILILDEPTSGLDPLMQNRFIELIIKEKNEGKTILMSSHNFEEIEKTCDRVGIIKEGKFVAIDHVGNLKKKIKKIFTIHFLTELEATDFSKKLSSVIKKEKNYVQILIGDNINEVIKLLANYQLVSLEEVPQSLEQIFMEFYGGINHVESSFI